MSRYIFPTLFIRFYRSFLPLELSHGLQKNAHGFGDGDASGEISILIDCWNELVITLAKISTVNLFREKVKTRYRYSVETFFSNTSVFDNLDQLRILNVDP